MPIETPSVNPRINNGTRSDFVLCENFVFRLSTVDGFSHQLSPDSDGFTVVNFKSYTQTIADPEKRLFNYLVSKLNPKPVDETT